MNRRRLLLLGAALPLLAGAAGSGDPLADLLALLAARLATGRDVALAKWASGAAIEDPQREARVVDDARAAARAASVDPDAMAALVTAQITASKLLQRQLMAAWRQAGGPPPGPVPDLVAEVRPELDRIGRALPAALAAAEPILAVPGTCGALDAAAERAFTGVKPAIRAAAVAPLLARACGKREPVGRG